jgi:ABC-type lipoprotein release transport system permease subunit
MALARIVEVWCESFLVRRLSAVQQPAKPAMYAAIAFGYADVAIAACIIPMSRAVRLEPTAALRCE